MPVTPEATTHLDLGCGDTPRNPYRRDFLYGCDLHSGAALSADATFHYAQADLAVEAIPFGADFFTSVSAYDFLEHVPRQSASHDGRTANPFVRLMSEIHRVLQPGGVLLASTPAYPHPKAFQDPTHVNIITEETHLYFTGPTPYAARYGFTGQFEIRRVGWDAPRNAQQVQASALRKALRNWEHRLFKGGVSHVTWELVAVKQQSTGV